MRTDSLTSRWTALAVSWLNNENNWKWIRSGFKQKMDPVSFRRMIRQPDHHFSLYYEPVQNQPVGLVVLSNIDLKAKNARLWFVLGDKNQEGRGLTTQAVSSTLYHAFNNLDLESVTASAVFNNQPAIKILEKNSFNRIGVQRRCHLIDGKLEDRVLFDLLAFEYSANRFGHMSAANLQDAP